MSRLLTLDGRPLTWKRLHAANTAYWHHQPQEPARRSARCFYSHGSCSGFMARNPDTKNKHDNVPCGCVCHGGAS